MLGSPKNIPATHDSVCGGRKRPQLVKNKVIGNIFFTQSCTDLYPSGQFQDESSQLSDPIRRVFAVQNSKIEQT